LTERVKDFLKKLDDQHLSLDDSMGILDDEISTYTLNEDQKEEIK
jgi:hypothetical protein